MATRPPPINRYAGTASAPPLLPRQPYGRFGGNDGLGTILLIILILLLIGALPTWPYSGGWGYYPSGGLGLLLIIIIVLLVAGRI